MILRGIPTPPSHNNAFPTGWHGRRIKSKEYVLWERAFHFWSMQNHLAVIDARAYVTKHRPKDHVLKVDSDFFFAKSKIFNLKGEPKKNDTSNRLKILHDGLAALLWIDDKWFFDGSFSKRTAETDFCNVKLEWILYEPKA